MSELISGKKALIALANGEVVLDFKNDEWINVDEFEIRYLLNCIDVCRFRIKPRTITLNGIEVPAPFEPKEGDRYLYLNNNSYYGFGCREHSENDEDYKTQFGAWRTEEEIKQVVAALRSVFK